MDLTLLALSEGGVHGPYITRMSELPKAIQVCAVVVM